MTKIYRVLEQQFQQNYAPEDRTQNPKTPDRGEKAGKKQGYEKNLKKVKKNACIIMKTVI